MAETHDVNLVNGDQLLIADLRNHNESASRTATGLTSETITSDRDQYINMAGSEAHYIFSTTFSSKLPL